MSSVMKQKVGENRVSLEQQVVVRTFVRYPSWFRELHDELMLLSED